LPRPFERSILFAPVVILDSDDIILAEIASGLHLDQFEQDLALSSRRCIALISR
jgi:hypothetical protein